jgi:hypothetical protein
VRTLSRPRAATRAALLSIAVAIACTTGCLSGGIYQHTTEPFDVNFNETPSGLDETRGAARGESWKTLVIPLLVVAGRIQFDWGDMSVARAIELAGFETVHYADLETRSILGLWTERWLHVYGE